MQSLSSIPVSTPPPNTPPLQGLPNVLTQIWWRFFNSATGAISGAVEAAAGATTDAALAQASANSAQASASAAQSAASTAQTSANNAQTSATQANDNASAALSRALANVSYPVSAVLLAYLLSTMAITPIALFSLVVGVAPTALFTASSVTIVSEVVFTNAGAGSAVLSIYVVRSGGIPATTNVIARPTLNSNAPYIAQELSNLVLNPGDAIFASAPASINAVGSGWHT